MIIILCKLLLFYNNMDSVYLLIKDNNWEDIVVFLDKEEAIAASIKYSTCRVEIFNKNNDTNGYEPTYNYYANGIFIKNS